MKTEKTIYGLQQCFNLPKEEKINYPDLSIVWDYETYEKAHDMIVERTKKSPNIYFKLYSKTEIIEFYGNYYGE